jgi:uncharacterized membrane protein
MVILAAPILAAHAHARAASICYLLFSSLCHQLRERSFAIAGYSLAVCHRCTGIYAGLFLGSLLSNHYLDRLIAGDARRALVFGATAPILLDALLPYMGIWTSSSTTRCATGLLFGTMGSLLLARGIRELCRPRTWPCRQRGFSAQGEV